jgi:F5/8 type C domain
MSSEQQRRDMVESNVTALADRLRGAIRELDPTALVTMGFFAPNEPVEWRPDDNRLVLTRAVLERSTLDLADLHAYPGGAFDVADDLRQYGVTDAVTMPLVMGEMGAFKSTYSNPAEGASGLVAWQVEACQSFQGWLLWLEAETDDEVWGGAEADGVIDEALSPRARPDPCSAAGFVRQNLAQGATVRASNSTVDNPASFAVDGKPGTVWIAGAGPPQWIEIDLGVQFDVGWIELIVAQSPNGPTRHRVLVGAARSDLAQVALLRGDTADGDALDVELAAADGQSIRFVRIETSQSPSWVAWREVRVFGR